jgi:arginyl-tRNA synthetase
MSSPAAIPLRQSLETLVRDAFARSGLDPAHGAVELSRRPELSQFQANGAMAVAKAARRNPREVAAMVVAALADNPAIARISVEGPGFINLSVTDATLAQATAGIAGDARLGAAAADPPRRVLIDFGGPNVAKAMHVGHLRSSIIGDTLQRVFRFAGHDVVSDIHLGDWGLPMGMLIAEIERERPDLPFFVPGSHGPFPAQSPVSIDDLERLYPVAAQRAKDDPAFREAARRATAELQSGRPGYRALWEHFIAVSVGTLRGEFARLNVAFDLWDGESTVNDRIGPMVARMRVDGLVEISEGAEIVRVAREGDQKEIPPLILVKSDGGAMYGTTDLATIEARAEARLDLSLYVVDQRQHLHFEQVFRAAARAGMTADGLALEHVGFGTVNGPDGKPFKTRAGGVMKLGDLITMATDEALKRLAEAGLAQDATDEEKAGIARIVGIAALRFADLVNHRLSDYVFNLERFTRFEGKTGPYLVYTAVRAKSLLDKAAERGFGAHGLPAAGLGAPATDAERRLMLTLNGFADAVSGTIEKRAPNLLCEWAFLLAQDFNSFYQACHVLSETDAALRDARLTLVATTLAALDRVFALIGIERPARM